MTICSFKLSTKSTRSWLDLPSSKLTFEISILPAFAAATKWLLSVSRNTRPYWFTCSTMELLSKNSFFSWSFKFKLEYPTTPKVSPSLSASIITSINGFTWTVFGLPFLTLYILIALPDWITGSRWMITSSSLMLFLMSFNFNVGSGVKTSVCASFLNRIVSIFLSKLSFLVKLR